ncbi:MULTISPECIES: transporter substrate-binding domain-containing protein [Pseudanabaena]|uniref:Amino acid ABC transporter substrate-binding protein, PAAT family n=2 Tax=Pseudanabaena TaxID=1152 RepID=L8N242_9CYAN|nr:MULTISPECIES: transporter substrate-binding domain-containing protein [Pseudanabaena]ELS34267.1 amino acid ABC transporter substrate-binding protein, PAAT family [Pseudanabaena biceps PCC 7429]MDG3493564.1 transporter substrate-binding domain-containing protein [Pseudanabaena catenata USMAC16]
MRKLQGNTLFLTTIAAIALIDGGNYFKALQVHHLAIAAETNSAITPEINTLDKIQKRGKLIVGVKDNLPPLGFRDRSGNLVGLEIEIARELAKELNFQVELLPLSNRDRLTALQNNQVDLAIAQITVTTNRSRLVDFSLPYYIDSTIVIAKRGTNSQELYQPLAIGVIQNSDAIAAIQSQFPKAAIIGTSSYADGLAALQADKIKAFVGDRTSLTRWLQEHPDLEIIGQPIAVHSLAIAMPRGLQHLDLRDRVFGIVDKWHKNGWLKERAKYWGL